MIRMWPSVFHVPPHVYHFLPLAKSLDPGSLAQAQGLNKFCHVGNVDDGAVLICDQVGIGRTAPKLPGILHAQLSNMNGERTEYAQYQWDELVIERKTGGRDSWQGCTDAQDLDRSVACLFTTLIRWYKYDGPRLLIAFLGI